MREEGFRLAAEETSPLLAEVKQFMTLPPPYNEPVSLDEEGKEVQNKSIQQPPTMMEQVNDKQSESTDGGQQ